jgi:hypothetical protein
MQKMQALKQKRNLTSMTLPPAQGEVKKIENGTPPPKVAISTCPRKHGLKLFRTPDAGWWCSRCQSEHAKDSVFFGCRECDYDECERCAMMPLEKRQEEQVAAASSESESEVTPKKTKKSQKKNKRKKADRVMRASSVSDCGSTADEEASSEEPLQQPLRAKVTKNVATNGGGTKLVPRKASHDHLSPDAKALSRRGSTTKIRAARNNGHEDSDTTSEDQPPQKKRLTNGHATKGPKPKRGFFESPELGESDESACDEDEDEYDDDSEPARVATKGVSLTKAKNDSRRGGTNGGAAVAAIKATVRANNGRTAQQQPPTRPRGGLDGTSILGRVLRAHGGKTSVSRDAGQPPPQPPPVAQEAKSEKQPPRLRKRSLAEMAMSELARSNRRL